MTDTAKTPATAAPPAGASSIPAPAGAVNPGPAIPAPFSFAGLFRGKAACEKLHRAVNLNGPRLDLQPSMGALLARLVLTSQDMRRQVEGLADRIGRDKAEIPTPALISLAEHVLTLAAFSEAIESASRSALSGLATRGQPAGEMRITVLGAGLGVVSFTPAEEGK